MRWKPKRISCPTTARRTSNDWIRGVSTRVVARRKPRHAQSARAPGQGKGAVEEIAPVETKFSVVSAEGGAGCCHLRYAVRAWKREQHGGTGRADNRRG